MAAISVAAVGASYLLSLSGLDLKWRTGGFVALTAGFLLAFAVLYAIGRRQNAAHHALSETDKLELLDEAQEIFSGSLSTADAFRLAVSRIALIVPCRSACLWLRASARDALTCTEVVGECVPIGFSRAAGEGIAGKAAASRTHAVGQEAAGPTAAIPLVRGGEVVAVVQLFFSENLRPSQIDEDLLTGIGSRTAPLLLSSIALDLTRSNALTDITTDLPNERSFYLVLENQIFEAARNREHRPLTILAINVRDFEEINARFGASAADAVLNHAAQVIKDELRQMDFIARFSADEFFAILPTAAGEISSEVIERLRRATLEKPVDLGGSSVQIELDFGWSAFGGDGETAATLVRMARLRRDRVRYGSTARVLSFSKTLVT